MYIYIFNMRFLYPCCIYYDVAFYFKPFLTLVCPYEMGVNKTIVSTRKMYQVDVKKAQLNNKCILCSFIHLFMFIFMRIAYRTFTCLQHSGKYIVQ